ncbi:FHA domain-containing protein [Laspinema olomoucense]|uniref:FHA domain-containing protein n=1 Tax=Laspinema olomoucense TaxID=3231600 RepID=UPI0021BB5250|nr:FHA domain-containing protein [Laspinema sp. D3d]MCT7973422.1 FHA domain-containing protein [Laspinema sp. D3d]
MINLIPYLIIHSPSGQQNTFELRDISYSIGRLPENQIALPEDPDHQITRIKHGILTRNKGQWVISDHSTNGTKVEFDGTLYDLHQSEIALQSSAVIHISNWRLTFYDPNTTRKSQRQTPSFPPLPVDPSKGQFIYKIAHATLYYESTGQRQSIVCRPQVNQMLTYMAQRNLDNQGQPIVCHYQDLIEAIWPNEDSHTSLEINGLAREIRKIFEQYSPETDPNLFLKTIRRLGYLLDISCEW